MLPQFGDAFIGTEHQAFTWHGDNGKVAILVHGYPGTPHEMRPLAHLLHRAGWTTHAPLLPGFGADIETLAERTHDEWINAIEDAVRTHRQTHDQVVLVGLSMGGAICINLAVRHAVDGLVLLAPFVRFEHILWRLLPVLRIPFPKMKPFRLFKPDFEDPKTQESIKTFMPDVDLSDPDVQTAIIDFEIPVTMLNQIRQLGQSAYRLAPQVTTPALVIQGKQDDLVEPQTTRQLVARFNGHTRHYEFDAPHDLVDTDSQAWAKITDALMNYLDMLNTRGVAVHD